MAGPLKRWWRQRRIQRSPIDDRLWRQAVSRLPLLHGLAPEELARLREGATWFLLEKEFFGVNDAVDESLALAIAIQAALPVLHLDWDYLEGWYSVVVYAGGFRARHEYQDEAGVAHYEEPELSGEAWETGPLVLSAEDVRASAAALDGYNLVIHEIAHKLDMLNGEANGLPPLHRGMAVAEWSAAWEAAYADFCGRVDHGELVPLDDYAAESPAECFSVFSEAFFETPGVLDRAYSDVYRQLAAFYRQDPGRRLGG